MEKYNEKIKKIFDKDNYTIIKLIILFIVTILVSTLSDIYFFKKMYGFMSFDRVLIVSLGLYFIGMHFIIKLEKMYNFIYKKRYLIALVTLIFIVIMGYSGSSISNYNKVIQASIDDKSYNVVLGHERPIRSDEWGVNTPLSFSQNKNNNMLPYFTFNIRGTKTDMFTIINAPVLDIVSIGKLFNIGYIFGNKVGLSFWWFGRLIALMLVSFELCMVISKNKKIVSLVGMLLITFSPAVQWWYSNFIADILIIGNLAIVLIDKFMVSKKQWIKYICVASIAVLAVSYVFTFYPAWLIPFTYVYLALFIFIVIKNRKEYKINKKDIISFVIAIIAVLLIILRYYNLSKETLNFVLNTDYPGQRFEVGGGAAKTLFSYVYSIYLPFYGMENPCEVSSMISFFPIPMIIALILMINSKNRKEHYKFLIPILIVSAIFGIWTLIPTNSIFAKLTLLYMSPAKRVAIPLGFAQVLLIIYLLANINKEEKIVSKKIGVILSVILTTIIMIIALKTVPQNYLGSLKTYVSGILMLFSIYFMFTINKGENKKYLMGFLAFLAILSGVFVNPILKDIDVIYEKPLSKEVSKIVNEDGNALWIAENPNITVPNYLAALGTKIINSTNYYPNFDLMKEIFGDKADDEKIRKIYNRYAHIIVNIVDDECDLELVGLDCIKLKLNNDMLKKLGVKYICSIRDLEKYTNSSVKFEKLYYEDSYYLYKLNY